jgi:hypothetical protein
MAPQTTSGAAATRADSARPDPTRFSNAFAYDHSDAADKPIRHQWRERAHRQARRHRQWLHTRTNPDGNQGSQVRSNGARQDASERWAPEVGDGDEV